MTQIVKPSTLTTTRRRKREIIPEEDLNKLWTFHPKQIIVPVGSVFTISPEDLEEGHNSDEESKRNFKLVRDGNDLYMTTLGSLTEWDSEPEELTTIVLADYFDAETKAELFPGEVNLEKTTPTEINQNTPKFVDVSLKLQENITFFLNNSEIVLMTKNEVATLLEEEKLETWEDLLEQSETEVLKNFPEVTHRTFVKKSKFVYVRIFHYTFEINEEHMIYVYMVLTIIGCVFVACILCVIKKLRSRTYTVVATEEAHSYTPTNREEIELLECKNL